MVIPLVQAAHGDLASRVGKGLAGADHGEGELIQEVCLLCSFGLFLVFRRHLSGVQGGENFLPILGLLNGLDVEGEVLEIDFSLLGSCVVAIETVFVEEVEVFFRKVNFGLRGGGERAAGGQGGEGMAEE